MAWPRPGCQTPPRIEKHASVTTAMSSGVHYSWPRRSSSWEVVEMAAESSTRVGGFHGPQVCGLVGITYRQLDYWARTGLLQPSADRAPAAAAVHRFCVESFEWNGAPCLVAGTGYTGEDGVECAVPAEVAPSFWEAVLAEGVVPAGLGARDTLRLEAGLPLHGHELGPGITPLQAGLGWVVGWDKQFSLGKLPSRRERRLAGRLRRLRGIVADGSATATGRGGDLPRPDPGRHPDQRELFAHARVRHRPGLRRCRCAAARRRRGHAAPTRARAGWGPRAPDSSRPARQGRDTE